MTREYEGKYFSLLGDSISTLAGFNPPECAVFYDWQRKRQAAIRGPEDTWWGLVLEDLGGKLLVNHSWSGSLVTKQAQCEVESYGCSDGRTAALGAKLKKNDYRSIDIGIAAAYLTAEATAQGLGTCILGWLDDEKLRNICGLEFPARLVITLGYPKEDDKLRSKKRKEPDALVTMK